MLAGAFISDRPFFLPDNFRTKISRGPRLRRSCSFFYTATKSGFLLPQEWQKRRVLFQPIIVLYCVYESHCYNHTKIGSWGKKSGSNGCPQSFSHWDLCERAGSKKWKSNGASICSRVVFQTRHINKYHASKQLLGLTGGWSLFW